MVSIAPMFAETNGSGSGIGAFNINLKSFVFQLITFVIVLLVLKRWVFPKLIETIEARRKTLEESLVHAKQTEETLNKAEQKADQIIAEARQQADRAIHEAGSQAKDIITQAESAAEVRSNRIIEETKGRLGQERQKLHDQLKSELTELVVLTTEKVLHKKLNAREDSRLVDEAVREIKV